MDPRVMELRIKKWIPVIEEQAKSGMTKNEWCATHGIERTSFFRWQKRVRAYLFEQCETQPSKLPSSIRYGGFSIDLNGGVDAGQLSTVMKVLKDVNFCIGMYYNYEGGMPNINSKAER